MADGSDGGDDQDSWSETQPRPSIPEIIPAPYGGYLLTLLIGAAGSAFFVRTGLPLPWFLGALTACLVASVAHLPVKRPNPLSIPMRAVLGVAVGTAYTPALIERLPSMIGSLALLVPFMGLIITVGMAFYERIAKFDRPTAFYSAVPGGLTDMTTMAEDSGANVRAVILVQASRILVIVFALPLWLQWHDGISVARTTASRIHIWEIWPSDALLMIAMGWGGWWIARRIGMAGAPIVGPMLASGIAHAMGYTAVKMPLEVLVAAQISVGAMLGCQFRGLTLNEFTGTMTWGVANAVVLLIVTGAVAACVSHLTGFDPVSVLLAFAPGGQTELNLLAFVLGLDVAYVALHHLTRLAVVILGAQMIFRTKKHWRR
jgi:membrane AbrB-like protein